MLYANVSAATLNMTLQAKNNETVVLHQLLISSNTTGHVPVENPPEEEVEAAGRRGGDEEADAQVKGGQSWVSKNEKNRR